MNVHYYEAAALTHSGNAPGTEVTLQDRHQTAWRLFSGEAHFPGRQREFVFRTERLGDSRELYIIRSALEFNGAKKHEISLDQGTMLHLEWVMSPIIRDRASPDQANTKRRQAPRERWEEVARRGIERHGFSVVEDQFEATYWDNYRQFPKQKGRVNLLLCKAHLKVEDSLLAATAWLNGAARMRAYGQGMLSLVKE